MDPDNRSRPIGKGCQQGAKIPLHQQQLELLGVILVGQRSESLQLRHPLLHAMPKPSNDDVFSTGWPLNTLLTVPPRDPCTQNMFDREQGRWLGLTE